MDTHEIEAGLRAITLTEPELGFNPDDVATRAAKHQRQRRSGFAAAGGTVAVAAVAVALFASGGAAVIPLTPATPATPSRHGGPPPNVHLPAQVERIKKHLDQVFPTIVPGAHNIEPATGDQYPNWDIVSATKVFKDSEGPASFNISVNGSYATANDMFTPDEICANGCDRFPQPDGSFVIMKNLRSATLPANGTQPSGKDLPPAVGQPSGAHPLGDRVELTNGPVVGREATHFRRDGSSVGLYMTNIVPASQVQGQPGQRSTPPLTDQQIIALITDPGFNLN